ncbi:hypothetical protein AC739_12255 [Planococcus glaciei]|uniref:hypothetical protein n=1 Tax=Caryophanaceae TaxID=186818 RepID=UPI00069FB92F|nr:MULTISPECIES: hypothetical protein [Planococcaceae]KOF10027.1 hypothetical protein AC739_12255 [Planococcus glaciei]
MQKILVISLLLALVGVFFIFTVFQTDEEQTKQIAEAVLDNVIAKKYDQAAEQMFFFEGGTNEEPTITQKVGKSRWIERIKDFDESGVSVIGYEKLNVEVLDSMPLGYVDVIIKKDGKEEQRQDVYIKFKKENNEWKVQSFEFVDAAEDWELALSGYVP